MFPYIFKPYTFVRYSLFVCIPVIPPCEISEGIVCVCSCVSSFVHLPASVWPFTVTEKSDCDKINFVLVMISIITILVKLLEIILSRVTSFVVYWFFCHFVCVFEWSVFYILIRFFFIRKIFIRKWASKILKR